ncbi:MAG: hypothetical protein Q9174_002312, partial [Haloplaca sp. 1 TL-2023]
AIAEDILYFMGGDYTFNGGDTTSNENKIYWIDLKTSFPLDSILPPNVYNSANVAGPHWKGTGALFANPESTTLYHFAGFVAPDNDTVASYDIAAKTWNKATVSGGSFNAVSRAGAVTATSSSTDLGLGFILGGSGEDTPPGLITLDASRPDSLEWTNKTRRSPNIALGNMQYARFGNKGVLIAFGGYSNLVEAEVYDMSLIQVYDVDSNTWFNITATGDVPSARSEMCSVISASPDDSSFQITVYGGYSIRSGSAFSDVYVLAIPAFRWIKIDVTENSESNLDASAGRYAMSCALHNDRQMWSIGGNIMLSDDNTIVNQQSCNSSWGVIRMLDTATFEWQSQYAPSSAEYAVSDQISKVIGGGPAGRATMTSPRGGFNDSALDTIFSKVIPRTRNTGGGSTPGGGSGGGTNGDNTEGGTPSSSTPVGAIAGGTVGGVALVILVIGGAIYAIRRRRQKSHWPELEDQHQGWGKPELSAHTSFPQKDSHGVQELHADDLPQETDGNAVVEAPPGVPGPSSAPFELQSTDHQGHPRPH